MKVFWSWQSDTPAECNKDFVKEALQRALDQVSEELGFNEAERPEVDHDTKGAPGLVSIVDEIFRKIEQADVFVGDVTFIGSTASSKFDDTAKLLPNPNVMIELGHAITSVGYAGIILVANTAFGGSVEDLPFDLRHRRGPILYTLAPDASPEKRAEALEMLTEKLVEALTLNLRIALERRDAESQFILHPSREGDRSTWLQPKELVRHSDPSTSLRHEWAVPEAPRAYMRLAPARWTTKPTRHQAGNAELKAMGPWRAGDFGHNEHGYVVVGFRGQRSQDVCGVTQWFHKTGELWGFTNTATYEEGGKRFLSSTSLAKAWDEFLAQGLRFFERFGAMGRIRVEAGVTGIGEAYYPTDRFLNDRWPSHEQEIYLEGFLRKRTREERHAFLTDLNNRLLDAFGLPAVDPCDVPGSP